MVVIGTQKGRLCILLSLSIFSTAFCFSVMMVGSQHFWEKYGQDDPDTPSPMTEPEWASLCETVGLTPQLDLQDIRPGGRGVREPVLQPVPVKVPARR